ncbi:MAG: ABC transporter substrate-binding protein [Burkholderiaceae bacterium]|nr:ABC transporter substrate-binding protein [Burkholderiaceae bacterium]
MRRFHATLSAAVLLGIAQPACAQFSGDVIRIGFITDMSSVYADVDGPGGVEAIQMAIADMGGAIDGKKIELLVADHQHKADIASAKAREWFDQQGLDMLIAGTNSATGLAMAKVATERRKPLFAVGAGTTRLTNEECSPYIVQHAYDTTSAARGSGAAIVAQGGKTWFFLTADYAYGLSLEKEVADVVESSGGTVKGRVRHPISALDYSSFLMQAQASKAQVLGLANAGGDLIASIKAASEFGVNKSMKLAAPLMFETDIHALGLDVTQGMYTMSAWYWDMNEESRAWAKRFFAKMNKAPTFVQAGDYSAALHYLKAASAIGTDDGARVMEQVRKTPVNDMFARNGRIRPDGRMVHDMYLLQVKSPTESKYAWDYFKVVQTIPGDQVFMTKDESKCALWQ